MENEKEKEKENGWESWGVTRGRVGKLGLNPYRHLLLCAYAKVQRRQNDTCFVSFHFPRSSYLFLFFLFQMNGLGFGLSGRLSYGPIFALTQHH